MTPSPCAREPHKIQSHAFLYRQDLHLTPSPSQHASKTIGGVHILTVLQIDHVINNDQLISLNAKTGRLIKSFGNSGVIKIGSSPIPPVVVDNQLIIATFRPSVEAYDIFSGKLHWKYYLREINKKVFGERDFKGGVPWGGMSADVKNGMVYLTTGNPKPNFVGTSRPGKNLFANSLIAFDVRNKKKIMALSRNMS